MASVMGSKFCAVTEPGSLNFQLDEINMCINGEIGSGGLGGGTLCGLALRAGRRA